MGYTINHKAVQRIVQKRELQVRSFTHKSRKYNSYKEPIGKVADNLLNCRFKTSIPHQKITTDTREFKYWPQGKDGKLVVHKLYFDPYMNLFNGGDRQLPYRADTVGSRDSNSTWGGDSSHDGLSLPPHLSFRSGVGVSDEVVHRAAERGENLSEYVTQGGLFGQQCDGEFLWSVEAGDLLWARLS